MLSVEVGEGAPQVLANIQNRMSYLGKREVDEVAKAITEGGGLDVCAMERYLKINLHREEGNVWSSAQLILRLLL